MAGARFTYRHLSRNSAHRKALLRNLVTSLFERESISTTWPKAKEAQRLAEKLITLSKKNTDASRRRAHEIFFRPLEMVPKLFGPIRERYLTRPGGYTRVLRIEPLKEDQAPSAILELVDGPKDMRFHLTAQTLARDKMIGRQPTEMTLSNVKKVTQFRGETGKAELEQLVDHFQHLETSDVSGIREPKKEKIYTGAKNKERSFQMYMRAGKQPESSAGASGSAGLRVRGA